MMYHLLCYRAALHFLIMLCLVIGTLILPLQAEKVMAQATGELIFAITETNQLIRFTNTTPNTLSDTQPISGLQPDESLLGIDFRPADGRLYALGSTNRLYTLNPQTGAATVVASEPFTATLGGDSFGFDFNPVPDRIRVVSDAGQDLRLHPVTGAVAGIDASLVYTDTDENAGSFPEITAAAYSNNISGSTTTTLYVIDTSLDILARQGGLDGPPSPNSGLLFSIGALDVDVSTLTGFDISPDGDAYAAFTVNDDATSGLYTIDLLTGQATLVDTIGGGAKVTGLAIPTQPLPPPAEPIFAVTSANRLLRFTSVTPGLLTASQLISGLQSGENVLGIDFRPADGRLYALGSTSRIYTVDTVSGAATVVGTQPLTQTLTGAAFGFDFNPVPDRIRLISDAKENLRIHPVTGVVVGIDATLAYSTTDTNTGANPELVSAAYTNNMSGTTTTTLYAIDAALDILVRQGGLNGPPSPNTGLLFSIGALGVDATQMTGFDVSPSGVAYAAITASSGPSNFYWIDLSTGAASTLGVIGGNETVIGVAAPTSTTIPAAQTVYAATSDNRLIQFSSNAPGVVTASQVISGLQSSENVLGIDFRPADGKLYALGSTNRLYTIDPATGLATLIGTQPFTPTLNGAAFGVDFNPVPDRIRVVSDAEQNLRLHPGTGAVAGIDSTLVYTVTDINTGVNPDVVAAAYTNNISGSQSTTLYVIDANRNLLSIQGGPNGTPSPNGGQLFTVGELGLNTDALTSFDIAPNGAAFAAVTVSGTMTTTFAVVNLASGKLTPVGVIGGGETIVGLALAAGTPSVPLPPPPVTITYFPLILRQE